MKPVRSWKPIIAIGCSHGKLAHPKALAAVLRFCDAYKPVIRVHLGDAYDTAALRSGAKGTRDETEPISDDIDSGVKFLSDFRPTVFTEGNHDFRPRKLMGHHNTIIAEASKAVYERMMSPLWRLKTEVRQWSVFEAWECGGYRFWHGSLFGENYLRDTANVWGSCVVAHAHRAGIAKGVRLGSPTCYGVGTLMDIRRASYAAQRKSTMAWSHGFVWGEICQDRAQLYLHEWPEGETEWRLPQV